jgi:hypothetical protein
MSHFSSALKLTDLDDFITPSQACINPEVIKKTAHAQVTRRRVVPVPISCRAGGKHTSGVVYLGGGMCCTGYRAGACRRVPARAGPDPSMLTGEARGDISGGRGRRGRPARRAQSVEARQNFPSRLPCLQVAPCAPLGLCLGVRTARSQGSDGTGFCDSTSNQ